MGDAVPLWVLVHAWPVGTPSAVAHSLEHMISQPTLPQPLARWVAVNAVDAAPGANVATVSHSLHPPSFQRARIVVVPAPTCVTEPLADTVRWFAAVVAVPMSERSSVVKEPTSVAIATPAELRASRHQ